MWIYWIYQNCIYNSQIAVDSKYKFIVASEVSSNNNDAAQLYTMAKLSKEVISVEKLTVVADTGYESAIEIKKCIDDNITPIIPKANKQKAQEDKGLYVREKFVYDKQSDSYKCPNNQEIKKTNSIMTPFFKTSKSSFLIPPLYDTSGNSFTPFETRLLSA